MSAARDVLADALALPSEERARLARELLRSLDEPAEPGAAEAWLDEIEGRAREVEAGAAKLEAWESVRGRLEARWPRR